VIVHEQGYAVQYVDTPVGLLRGVVRAAVVAESGQPARVENRIHDLRYATPVEAAVHWTLEGRDPDVRRQRAVDRFRTRNAWWLDAPVDPTKGPA
jgi:hypothetical protein